MRYNVEWARRFAFLKHRAPVNVYEYDSIAIGQTVQGLLDEIAHLKKIIDDGNYPLEPGDPVAIPMVGGKYPTEGRVTETMDNGNTVKVFYYNEAMHRPEENWFDAKKLIRLPKEA